ncbi:permease, partial [Enterococcus faecalis]|nr:permease [Enterococcus faecalis]
VAFIGFSFLSMFGTEPIVPFLLFGPMVDINNLLRMTSYFKIPFIVHFFFIVALVVTIYPAVV